jgi:hypothetical protein
VSGAFSRLQDAMSAIGPQPDLGVVLDGAAAVRARDTIAELCRRHRVRRILDLGGRALPVLRALPDATRCEYIGIDWDDETARRHRAMFPRLTFIGADPRVLGDLELPAPDLALCLDVLPHIQDDTAYESVVEFLFNCGARGVALTCAVGRDGAGPGYRDFWARANRLCLGYVHKTERPFRSRCERILAFDLCEPAVHSQPTEVVYVCSPDRERQLLVSLETLLESGRSFDRVVIFCVGHRPPHWSFSDPRVVVKQVPALFGDYFFGNKIYLCGRRASRVVFLDTDTIVQRPLDLLWQDRDADLLGRAGAAYEYASWKPEWWRELFRRMETPEAPMLNAGLLVFQNHAHRRIRSEWPAFVTWYLAQEFPPPFRARQLGDQMALALATGRARLRYAALGPSEHAYGWRGEPHDEAVVVHTGHDCFDTCAGELGLQSPPVSLLRLRGGDGAGVQPDARRLIEDLNAGLYELQNELTRVQGLRRDEQARLREIETSRALAAGNLLASLARMTRAAARLDGPRLARQARLLSRSFDRLIRKPRASAAGDTGGVG